MAQPNMGGGLGPSMQQQQQQPVAHNANSSAAVGYAHHHSPYGHSPMNQQAPSPQSSHPQQVSQHPQQQVSQYLTVGTVASGQQRPLQPQQQSIVQHGVYVQQQQHPGQLVTGHHQQHPQQQLQGQHYIVGPGPQQRPMQQPQQHFQQQQQQQQMAQQMQRQQMPPYSTAGPQGHQHQQQNQMVQQVNHMLQQSPNQQMMPPPQQMRMPVSQATVMLPQHAQHMQQGGGMPNQQQMMSQPGQMQQRMLAPGPPQQGHFPRAVILPPQLQHQQSQPAQQQQQQQQVHILSGPPPQQQINIATSQVPHFAHQNTAPQQSPSISSGSMAANASQVFTAPASTSSDFPMSDSSSAHQVLTKQRLDDLTKEVDPYEQLDEDVKDALLQYADDFIESLVSNACQMAKHRKSNTLDVKDVQLALERNWNMWIPGFGSEEIRPYKKSSVTEAHKQRMALIKKTLKKI